MSLFTAINTAVSGLSTQASRMGHISDNIANVSTTAYKKITTDFSTMVTQSGRRVHTPGGVRSQPYYNVSVQGQMQQSTKSTHMGINGDGFFIVRNYPDDAETQGLNKKNLFTRKGDFNIDANGNMVNSSGYYLMGRQYDLATGDLLPGDLVSVNVSNMAGLAQATSEIKLGANLPADSDVVGDPQITTYTNAAFDVPAAVATTIAITYDRTDEAGNVSTSTINVNVAAGELPGDRIATTLSALADFTATYDTATDTLSVTGPNGYDFALEDAPGTLLGAAPVTAPADVADPGLSAVDFGLADVFTEQTIYDSQGQAHTIRNEFAKTANNVWEMRIVEKDANGDWQQINDNTAGEITLTFNTDGTMQSIVPGTVLNSDNRVLFDPGTIPMALNNSLDTPWQWDDDPIEFDVGELNKPMGLTQFSEEFSVTDLIQNGLPYGQFSGVQIDEFGDVYAEYGNGATVKIYQLPLAVFSNPDGLQNRDGNTYEATAWSGDPSVLAPGVGRGGKVISEALEGSNVDIAEEFTQMIQTQRAYSANSRVITTADSMMDEILRIKS